MATQHTTHLLLAHLDGLLPRPETEQVSRHLAACPDCASEREILAQARGLLPSVSAEPRPGFAQRVARNAADAHARPLGAPWWRWAFGGGLAAAGLAALVLVAGVGRGRSAQPSQDLRVAQRLDLYEDMTVLQNQDALEDLDVVEVLHTLQPEAKP